MGTCRIGTLNVHNRARAVRYMLRQRCDVLALSEANRVATMLARAQRYRVTVGEGGRDKRRGAAEVPVLTLKQHASLGSICLQASEQTQPERIAPDRWVTVAAQQISGVGAVAVINVHPNAVTDDLSTAVPRVRESAELWATVDRLLSLLRAEGMLCVLVGDINARKGRSTPGWVGAYDVIDAHELRSFSQGLDVIAYDERLRLVGRRVVARDKHGSDHPGLIAELGRAS